MKKKTMVKIGIRAALVAAVGTSIYAVRSEKKKIKLLEKQVKELRDTVDNQREVINDFNKYFGKEVDPAE